MEPDKGEAQPTLLLSAHIPEKEACISTKGTDRPLFTVTVLSPGQLPVVTLKILDLETKITRHLRKLIPKKSSRRHVRWPLVMEQITAKVMGWHFQDQCTRRLRIPPYYWPSLILLVCAGHCHVMSCYMEGPTQTGTERGLSQQLMRNWGFSPTTGKEVNPANNHVSEYLFNLQVWRQTWLTPGLLPCILRAEACSKTIPRFPSHRHCRGQISCLLF